MVASGPERGAKAPNGLPHNAGVVGGRVMHTLLNEGSRVLMVRAAKERTHFNIKRRRFGWSSSSGSSRHCWSQNKKEMGKSPSQQSRRSFPKINERLTD